jgi:hypothetical protein
MARVGESVQVLWFVQEREKGDDTELFIGAYKTEADAQAAINRLRDKPGFVDFPAGFQIYQYELGKDHWEEGFARV